MGFITVDASNIDQEHICCAIADKKGENRVSSKKAWLKERFKDGLVFKKLDARGKVLIEYMPAEKCFAPITAPDYMYISCLWVSGQYKGKGYASRLLELAIEDAKSKGKKGLVALGSKKKMSFLTDPKFLKYKGFKICDEAKPSFELLALSFDETEKENLPRFRDAVRDGRIDQEGVVLYYSNGCPHTVQYVPIVEEVFKEHDIPYEVIKLETVEEAQSAPTPCTIYTLYIDGEFVTNEVLTKNKCLKYLKQYGLV